MRAIEERDSKEKANESLFDTCVFMTKTRRTSRGQALYWRDNSDTRLADRAAGLASPKPEPAPLARIESSDGKKASRESRSKAGRSKEVTASLDVLAKVREDLGEAQRSKGAMQAQLQSLNEEVAELRAQSQVDKRRIRELGVEKTNLVKRMRDLDEELKGKAKLLEVCFAYASSLNCSQVSYWHLFHSIFMMKLYH